MSKFNWNFDAQSTHQESLKNCFFVLYIFNYLIKIKKKLRFYLLDNFGEIFGIIGESSINKYFFIYSFLFNFLYKIHKWL